MLEKVINHHFISQSQCQYISNLKNNLRENEMLLQCDFSENYAYVAQDAAQAFHYNHDQCMLHPLIIYYKSENVLKHSSITFLSDSITHDASAVYIMQQSMIPESKKLIQMSKKLYILLTEQNSIIRIAIK